MSRRAATLRALLVGSAWLAADQATKALVRATVERGGEEPLGLGISLVNTRNSGVAFGLFQDAGAVLVVVTVLALAGVVAFFVLSATRPGAWIPLGLLVGGAAGNLVDRIREGEVTDFIDFPAWPPFNLADVGITVGVIAMLWVMERPRGSDRPA